MIKLTISKKPDRPAKTAPFKLTIIHPCIGRQPGKPYIRTWQMEPLPAATLAGLTPKDVTIRFYDDRMEDVPFDEPTDLVAISVETYTAKRAYQLASEFRKRGVPVVMGGFHVSLCPDEVSQYAEAIVIGEAEQVWETVIDDFRHGTPQRVYKAESRPGLGGLKPDRSIFKDKRYLPVGLVESGRGCHFKCEFCAVTKVFGASQTRRPIDDILEEVQRVRRDFGRKLIFFVDDNITSNMEEAKEFYRRLAPLNIRWVSQSSINAAHDEEFLTLLGKSGCMGVLIGFESIDARNLASMNKKFNTMGGGFEVALANLRKHNVRVYGTFVFGYDHDTAETFKQTVSFAQKHGMYIAAFNHLTPFPGTPLYERLQKQGRLRFEKWWLDDTYRYNMLPFTPAQIDAQEMQKLCIEARREFYSWPSIFKRSVMGANKTNAFMFRQFFLINALHRADVSARDHYPLGDPNWQGKLIQVS